MNCFVECNWWRNVVVVQVRDWCKLSSKHLLIISFSTLLFIYFISTKLNFDYRVAFIFSEPSQTDSWQFEMYQGNISSNNCSPLIFGSNQYSVEIDGVRYPKSIPLHKNRSINFDCLQQANKKKIIFAWNPFFGQNSYDLSLKSHTCPVTNCIVTSDKNLLNISDFVLVHMRDTIPDPPSYRPSFQRWIFVLYESPIHAGNFERYKNFFNLTSTYRIESNFSGFYESHQVKMQWELNTSFNDSFDFFQTKSKFATAVISNCGASSRRLEYINELQKYVSVDVFGRCGQSCPQRAAYDDCKDILGKEYKFYLAFENSICSDYITEKFFYILQYDIIPVVLGGGSYDHFIPKSGFINAQDFASPKKLAEYLIYLDSNRTAYNSFFKWKKHVKFYKDFIDFSTVCDMCIKLQLEEYLGIEKSVIEDIDKMWSRKLNCKRVKIDAVNSFSLDKI